MVQDENTPQKSSAEMSRDDQIVFWVLIFVVLFTTLD